MPIARTAEAAGHIVAFTAGSFMVPSVERAGFTCFPTVPGADSSPAERRPLLRPDPEREDRDLRELFARQGARERTPGILAVAADWRPDLVVCDETDFGCVIAAERLGLPYATVQATATGSFVRNEVVVEPLSELRAEHGLPPDPDLVMLTRDLVLVPFPLTIRHPAFPLPVTAHLIRLSTRGSAAPEATPPWLTGLEARPTIYFSLGTVFNLESGDLFDRVLAGLRDLPVSLVMTVGRDLDPEAFGPQPANVHIERYVAQAVVLPIASLVVSHGGSGGVMGALSHGVPMVLIPMGADQLENAARCAEIGVARVLDAVDASPADIAAAAAAVLADPGYRRAAERIRDEIDALPGPDHAVRLLERLGEERASATV